MGQGKNYTAKEDSLILDYISRNPGNIRETCDEVGELLNRPGRGIQGRWYKVLSKKTDKVFIMYGKNKHSFNKKNTKKLVKHKVSFWHRMLKLLN